MVTKGERPPRGVKFTKSLWEMLEWCWASGPNDRPSIEEVLHDLEMVSNSSEPPSPGADEGMDEEAGGMDEDDDGMNEDDDEMNEYDDGMDQDDWDSPTSSPGFSNGTSVTTAELNAATSFGPGYLTDHSPSPISTTPLPPTVEAISNPDVDGLDREADPSIPPINSKNGGTHQVSAT